VFHVAERTQTSNHDVVTRSTVNVGDERHATGIVFETGVVQAVRGRHALNWVVGVHRLLFRVHEHDGSIYGTLGTTLARTAWITLSSDEPGQRREFDLDGVIPATNGHAEENFVS
jgi:hypothetical protein